MKNDVTAEVMIQSCNPSRKCILLHYFSIFLEQFECVLFLQILNKININCHAGHGLNRKNVVPIAEINEIKEFGEGRFVMSPMFKAYMNTYFRDVNKVFTNVKEIANGFVQYYSMQLDKEIASKKTKSTQDKYIKIKTDGLTFLKTNERPLYFTIASYMNIIEAKLYVIRRLERVKTLGTFLRTDNGDKVTAPEGFVAIQSGNALKLVDRLEFSRANFTAAKNWDQG